MARHLGQFGEIRITRLEPETAVAWEGSAARGTVRLEPAGWGTKVFLTATAQDAPPESEPVAQDEPGPEPEPPTLKAEPPPSKPEVTSEAGPPLELEPPVRRGLLARLKVLFGSRPAPPPPGSESQTRPLHLTSHQHAPPAASPPAAEPTPPAPSPVAAEPTPPAASPAAAEPTPMANPLDAALDSLGSAHHRPYSRA